MKSVVILDKKVGETPLMALEGWRRQHPAYAGVAASYAGRLDPMASGKLIVLLREECKRQGEYTGLDKEYEIEVLLGVGSDTGDVLGMPQCAPDQPHSSEVELANVLRAERGEHLRAYPAFSSKTVRGKPLFLHALEGTLTEIEIPQHLERIYRIRQEGRSTVSAADLSQRIAAFLTLVPRTNEPSKRLGADFRVDAIREEWQKLFAPLSEREWVVLRLRVTCGSGSYMRSLAGRIGTALSTHGLALSIRRTKIGRYLPLVGGMGVWLRSY